MNDQDISVEFIKPEEITIEAPKERISKEDIDEFMGNCREYIIDRSGVIHFVE